MPPKKTALKVRESIPESFSRLLRSVRVSIFEANLTTMSKYLLNVRRRSDSLPKGFRHDAVNSLESRTQAITFEHIETYSRLLGLPTSVLSFVSRYQHESLDEAERVAQAMLDVVVEAKKRNQKRLSIYDLHVLAARIDISFDGREPLPQIPLHKYRAQLEEEELAAKRRVRPGTSGELF